ncbi:IS4 family transposase [Gloeothece verrucosa]|nr:IS4 family transposase [Gloeothece verrucosa]
MMEDKTVSAQIAALLTPALEKQKKYCRQLGLRDRILTLPLMVAAVLTMLWRDVAGVRELTRILAREGFLWCDRLQVSQQALSKRFLTFPSDLFEKVFKEILPLLAEKWQTRNHRPLPESVQFSLTRFEKIWIADSSTLEALFKKLKSLEDVPKGQLAGKIGVVIDLVTRLPIEIWFKANPKTNDTKFEEDLFKIVEKSTLLLLDRGFYHFSFWLQLIDKKIHFISRIKKGAAIKVEEVFTESYSLRDRKIRLGSGTKITPYIILRLVEVKSGKAWHSYLTSVLEPDILPPYVVADLYRKRWRIEEEFNIVKRLLGLSYLWVGSINGVKLQIWGTWLFYAILIDLGDAVADELSFPFDCISLEMVYRGLYHFGVANQKGKAKDPVKYFAAPENKDLGIVKQLRKNNTKLIVAPFPEEQRNTPEFFFSAKSLTYS